MKRKFFLATALFALGLCLWKFFAKPERPAVPGYNVLFLSSDSWNKRHLAMYGYTRRTMPFLEDLATQGVVFENEINPSGWTNENLVSIFSALSSPIHKVESRQHTIDPSWVTPIDVLRDYGYRAPRLEGWRSDPNHNDIGFEDPAGGTDPGASDPVAWLDRYGREGPFFLFYQFLSPHLPYNGDHNDTDLFRSFLPSPLFRDKAQERRLSESVMKNSVNPNDGSLSFRPEDKEVIDALYDGELRILDKEFERVVRTLDRLGLRDRTIIVVSCDHGEELLEHGFVGHASTSKRAQVYDEIVNVPYLISFPEKLPRGARVTTQVRGIDVLPTILDLLEIPAPRGLEGRSALPVIRGEETADRVAFIQTSRAGYGEPDPHHITDRIRAVRTGEWKLMHYDFREDPRRFELFHVASDSCEQVNLIDTETEKARAMKQLLLDWVAREAAMRPVPGEGFESRSLYERCRDWVRSFTRRTDFSGVPSPPRMIRPHEGEVVTFATDSGQAVLRWEGQADVPYVVEYEIGEGDYHLTGSLSVTGNEKAFGPFPMTYWNTYLTLYNPYRIRVSIDKEPREWSPWVRFSAGTAH